MIEGLDPVIHPPKRLAAMALLAHASNADFGFLRDHLGVTDSDLSKQMSVLSEAGYVEIRKHGHGRGSLTSFRITRAGRTAYRNYRKALESLLDGLG